MRTTDYGGFSREEGMNIRFWVAGRPAPKGSRTVGRRKDGSTYSRPASKYQLAWAGAVEAAARDLNVRTLCAPYRLNLSFILERPAVPKYWWPTREDSDKLERNTLDGLVKAGVISDDRHVIECTHSKRFGDTPGCWVTVYSNCHGAP